MKKKVIIICCAALVLAAIGAVVLLPGRPAPAAPDWPVISGNNVNIAGPEDPGNSGKDPQPGTPADGENPENPGEDSNNPENQDSSGNNPSDPSGGTSGDTPYIPPVEAPEDKPDTANSSVDKNGNIVPDGGGISIKLPESNKKPAQNEVGNGPSVTPAEPSDGGTESAETKPSASASYSCGVSVHPCKTEAQHNLLLSIEEKGCRYCGSHSCKSFYVIRYGRISPDETLCPEYDVHKDPTVYCQTCGRKCGSGADGSCCYYLSPSSCRLCGKTVSAGCHSCAGND